MRRDLVRDQRSLVYNREVWFGNSSLVSDQHWGQGVIYPVGTCWLHWGHRHQVIKMCPPTPGWAHFKCSQLMWPQCTHTQNIQNVPKMCFWWVRLGHPKYIQNATRFSGHILNVADFSMYPQCFRHVPRGCRWVHWGHMTGNIPNAITMCPAKTFNSHFWVHFKCNENFPSGYIGVALCQFSQCNQHVPRG